MGRVPDISREELAPDARRIYDAIGSARNGAVRGPFAIWIRMPELAERANELGNVIRLRGTLDRRLFELAVLIVARHWGAQYEWFAHEPQARRAGVSEQVIDAIRAGREPHYERDDEAVVDAIVRELQVSRTLSAETYERGMGVLGLELLIELITAVGFYTMVAIVVNAFEAPVPGGARPLPDSPSPT